MNVDGWSTEEIIQVAADMQKVDKGLKLTDEEASWAVQQAFKHRDQLAFSKKELGLCTTTEFNMKLRDPDQKPIG